MNKIKVLIIDDSSVVCSILSSELSKQADIEVVGTAANPYVASEKIVELCPDVLTLDIEMPRMDGITFLGQLMKSSPMPVIILSSVTPAGGDLAMKALEMGALEVMHKPPLDNAAKLNEMIGLLANALRAGYAAKKRFVSGYKPLTEMIDQPKKTEAVVKTSGKIVAIGASTGGPEALQILLSVLPATFPGIVLVQHLPAWFTKAFAKRLGDICAMEVKEAEDGDEVRQGLVLVAPGDFHTILHKTGAKYHVEVKTGPVVFYHRPSIEVLFDSVAKCAGADAIGVILTGMGKDGATGLKKMKEAGAYTIAQDESTSVVYGMPKAAVEEGGVSQSVPLSNIPNRLIYLVSKK